MPGLTRTDLQTSQKVDLAAAAIAKQGKYGAVSNLADTYDVSRPTVYRAASDAKGALTEHFEKSSEQSHEVVVNEDLVRRAVLSLRVVGPMSIRQIVDAIPLIYPGLTVSYGKIQGILAEAERKAALFNQQADLSAIRAGAVDEMFSQGNPVLAGIDLDNGYLFSLELREGRSADDWSDVLKSAQHQGLQLDVVVKDAAPGIAAGVHRVFPDAEQRDDCFHAIYEMGKLRGRLERMAYGAMTHLEEAEEKREQHRWQGQNRKKRRQLVQKLNWAKWRCEEAMALHDDFERACRQAREAMEIVDLKRGEIRDNAWIQRELEQAAAKMLNLGNRQCQKVGRYLKNRAPGLALYARELRAKLSELSEHHGDKNVLLACLVWRLRDDLRNRRRPWRRWRDHRHLVGAFGMLMELASSSGSEILSAVDDLMTHRHRASSAIEGFNAFLRPYLYVHKGVSQGFLELLRAYYNLRTRRWGRHQGTSATQCLTGESTQDWLLKLGYPQSASVN